MNKENKLNGYVKNISNSVYYTFKRSVEPGGTISFDAIYDVATRTNKDIPKDESFIEFIKSRFDDPRKWQIISNGVIMKTTGATTKRSGKVRMTGGAIETAKVPEEVSTKRIKDMSHVTGLAPAQEPPEITPVSLLGNNDFEALEAEIVRLNKKGKLIRDKVMKGAILLASARGQDRHYRFFRKMLEKLDPLG